MTDLPDPDCSPELAAALAKLDETRYRLMAEAEAAAAWLWTDAEWNR